MATIDRYGIEPEDALRRLAEGRLDPKVEAMLRDDAVTDEALAYQLAIYEPLRTAELGDSFDRAWEIARRSRTPSSRPVGWSFGKLSLAAACTVSLASVGFLMKPSLRVEGPQGILEASDPARLQVLTSSERVSVYVSTSEGYRRLPWVLAREGELWTMEAKAAGLTADQFGQQRLRVVAGDATFCSEPGWAWFGPCAVWDLALSVRVPRPTLKLRVAKLGLLGRAPSVQPSVRSGVEALKLEGHRIERIALEWPRASGRPVHLEVSFERAAALPEVRLWYRTDGRWHQWDKSQSNQEGVQFIFQAQPPSVEAWRLRVAPSGAVELAERSPDYPTSKLGRDLDLAFQYSEEN